MMICAELKIPSPWGHIAAKTWGDENNEAIIVTHGRMDNAGSFDSLIPRLPNSFFYICLDLPGHGKSSHFNSSLPIHTLNFVIAYRIVVDHFNREKYILIGHSLGGYLSLFFAQLYPQYVSKVISIDSLYFATYSPNNFVKMIVKSIDALFKVTNSMPEDRPVYTYKEAIHKVINGRRHKKMTEAAAKSLVDRMVQRVGHDQYIFTFDQRTKNRIDPNFTYHYIKGLWKKHPVQCEVLILLSSEENLKQLYKPVYDYYNKLKLNIYLIKGTHDLHITNIEKVVPILSNFILKKNSKL